MKHIKTYKVFESNETEQDLKDILLELQDEGYIVIHNDDVLLAVTGEPSENPTKSIWVKDSNNPSYSKGLDWEELRDYALRIKDYLGDRYLSFMWRPILLGQSTKENFYQTIELNEDTEINEKIYSFVIKYK